MTPRIRHALAARLFARLNTGGGELGGLPRRMRKRIGESWRDAVGEIAGGHARFERLVAEALDGIPAAFREALSNVARHAQAKNSAVRLTRTGQTAVLTIEDDGVGFAVRSGPAGNGLRNMRERATAMGGSLRVSSKPGNGTSLRFTFPI